MGSAFTVRLLFAEPPAVACALPGARLAVRDRPLDDDAVARLAGQAWYWPGAGEALRGHRAQLEVALCAEIGTPVERALALTRAAASLAARPGCLAVVWEPTELAHEPRQWIAQAEDASQEDLPLFLWLAFEGSERGDGTRSLCTRGAPSFGAMEVEVAASRRDGEDVLETVCDVALFALTSPVALEDGEEVEVTRGRVRVRIEPSLKNDGSRAYRLRL